MGSHRVGHDWCDLAAAAACQRIILCTVLQENSETILFTERKSDLKGKQTKNSVMLRVWTLKPVRAPAFHFGDSQRSSLRHRRGRTGGWSGLRRGTSCRLRPSRLVLNLAAAAWLGLTIRLCVKQTSVTPKGATAVEWSYCMNYPLLAATAAFES